MSQRPVHRILSGSTDCPRDATEVHSDRFAFLADMAHQVQNSSLPAAVGQRPGCRLKGMRLNTDSQLRDATDVVCQHCDRRYRVEQPRCSSPHAAARQPRSTKRVPAHRIFK